MDLLTKTHLSFLKEALHALKDTGADGFEGLVAAVLSKLCGQPFRLASSGSQRGRDGDSAFDAGATYFEAKLYRGQVRREAVAPKLQDLFLDDRGQVDTWVLCATSPISSQHADGYRQLLSKVGIGCLILDWPEHTLPPLTALLVMAADVTAQFLSQHGPDTPNVADIRAHLDVIARDSTFPDHADSLRNLLQKPSIGLGLAKAANGRWFSNVFSDRREARCCFGQPLAPLDTTGLGWVDRPKLIQELARAFSCVPDEAVFLVIGEEGSGKSWLAAKAWLTAMPKPLLAFFTADELEEAPLAMHDLEGTLIKKLAEQTGDTTDSAMRRWKRRFNGWRANPRPPNVRVAVLVDGLNQVPDFRWPHWIDAAAKLLTDIGGRLVITTNERHFARRLRGIITSKTHRVIATDWNAEELRQILRAKGIVSDRLSADVFNSLLNPRILGIAIELLDAKDIERFEELTVGRLLFEHIRRCERDGTTDLPAEDFTKTLQMHADEVIQRISSQQHDDLKLFDVPLNEQLKAVANSRFFAPVAGESSLYSIRDDGLPLALGLSLISSLCKEHRNGRDPTARLSAIVEPILALAETSEVILSALQVACLKLDYPEQVQAALARYYVSLQNLPPTQRPAFDALAKRTPLPFLEAAQSAALSQDHPPQYAVADFCSAWRAVERGRFARHHQAKRLAHVLLACS
jgi:hypothetical protein